MAKLPTLIESLPEKLHSIDDLTGDVSGMQAAGVMVLLFPRGDDVRFVVTARAESLARHAGQISLPGGRMESQDRSLWDTARRETAEELGIRTGRLVPLGRLDVTPLVVSNYVIWPFVAWSPVSPRMDPDPREVAAVLEISLASLLDPQTIEDDQWEFRGARWRVTLYRFGDVTIWGATARVLSDLAGRLRPDLMSRSRRPGDVEQVV